jgi:uncharacterized protein YbjT (DUF2867 family)
MATAFVTGATGFVGRVVVERLASRGIRVIAHVRPDSRKLDEWRQKFGALGVEVDTTPWEREAMAATLARTATTHVFVLIGTTRKQAKADAVGGDIYETVDYGLTKLLADAAVDAGTRPRMIYLSSVGASEGSRSAYLRARGRAEAALRASKLPAVIARPLMIVSSGGGAERDDRRPMEKATAVVADGLLAVVGVVFARPRALYRSTTPETLADALVRIGIDGAPGTYDGVDLR